MPSKNLFARRQNRRITKPMRSDHIKLPNDFFETLRSTIPVSSVVRQRVTLTKRGVEYSGLCPFHTEKSPSFTVNDIKKFYHCFGCSAHGDVIRFVSETSGLGYKEAAIKLAEDHGIEIPKLSKAEERLYEEVDQIHHILNLTSEFFQKNLDATGVSYLTSRGIDADTIKAFSLGYAPGDKSLTKYLEKHGVPLMMAAKAGLVSKGEDGKVYEVFRDRIMFPIKNIYGKVIAFGGRTMSDANPKYLNSPETIVFKKNETLYGEDKALAAAYRNGNMIVVEGYMDVIAMHKYGFENTVASLGTAVTNKHIAKLWRSSDEIIMCLDGDAAGIRATQRVVDLALTQVSYNKSISFIQIPQKQDPDEVLQKNGNSYFARILENRLSLSEMIWYLETKGGIGPNAEERAKLEHRLENYATHIEDKVLSRNYTRFFKERLWKYFSGGRKSTRAADIAPPTNLSESDLIEHSIFSLLVKKPMLLTSIEVRETLSRLDIANHALSELREYLLAHADVADRQKLYEMLEKTRFSKLFMLLCAANAIFLDISSLGEDYHYNTLWTVLVKKHHLLKSKSEYALLLQSMTDENFSRAKLYHQEIIKAQQEIDQISESLINSDANR